MKYAELDGTRVEAENGQDKLLAALYTHAAGRILLKPFTGVGFSKAVGWFMNQPVSARLIASAIQEYRIDMTRYEETVYRTYNEFFTRRLCKEARQTTFDPDWLISPSDGKVSVYPITEKGRFRIKNTPYTMRRLLRDSGLAKRYEGGFLFVIRLTVDDYHRYCYPADGAKTGNRKVDGYFHTVNPVANDYYPIYKENTREYTCIRSEEFGDVLQMEVGAMCVGRIVNYEGKGKAVKGKEKGRFEFGGSTILVAVQKGRVQVREDLLKNTKDGYETRIRMGDKLGIKASEDFLKNG